MYASGLLGAFLEAKPALSRYLTLRGATPSLAEDLLQEMSLKLSAGGIGPVAEPKAYLYRMATNHLLLHRRGEQRRTQREGDWVEVNSADEDGVDQRPSAEMQMIHREQVAIVDAALSRLPERTRDIFLRFRVERESQRDIADGIGISISAVEKHLTRAYQEIAAIRKLLDGDRALPRHLSSDRGAL